MIPSSTLATKLPDDARTATRFGILELELRQATLHRTTPKWDELPQLFTHWAAVSATTPCTDMLVFILFSFP